MLQTGKSNLVSIMLRSAAMTAAPAWRWAKPRRRSALAQTISGRQLTNFCFTGIPFRHSAAFGKRIGYYIIGLMLKEGLDVYMPLVDDNAIDAVSSASTAAS